MLKETKWCSSYQIFHASWPHFAMSWLFSSHLLVAFVVSLWIYSKSRANHWHLFPPMLLILASPKSSIIFKCQKSLTFDFWILLHALSLYLSSIILLCSTFTSNCLKDAFNKSTKFILRGRASSRKYKVFDYK